MCNFPLLDIYKISMHQNFPFKSADCLLTLESLFTALHTLSSG